MLWIPHPKSLPQNEGGTLTDQCRSEVSPSLLVGARGRGMGGLPLRQIQSQQVAQDLFVRVRLTPLLPK